MPSRDSTALISGKPVDVLNATTPESYQDANEVGIIVLNVWFYPTVDNLY